MSVDDGMVILYTVGKNCSVSLMPRFLCFWYAYHNSDSNSLTGWCTNHCSYDYCIIGIFGKAKKVCPCSWEMRRVQPKSKLLTRVMCAKSSGWSFKDCRRFKVNLIKGRCQHHRYIGKQGSTVRNALIRWALKVWMVRLVEFWKWQLKGLIEN